MHWVDRGLEPIRLGQVQAQYTPRWIQYYRHGVGTRPTDSHWRRFIENLRDAFHGLCAYCEQISRGEVDHFRPKSRYPELVYSWSNWLFACHDCNHSKGSEWPFGGYVDPCADSKLARPEHHFAFDTHTGEILPNEQLSTFDRNRALRTIEDLGLNEMHHLKDRLGWLRLVSAIIPDHPGGLSSDQERYSKQLVARDTPHSSITRAWLSERCHLMKDPMEE